MELPSAKGVHTKWKAMKKYGSFYRLWDGALMVAPMSKNLNIVINEVNQVSAFAFNESELEPFLAEISELLGFGITGIALCDYKSKEPIPEGYDSHAEFVAERLRDDLRGKLDQFIPDQETVEKILDDITEALYEVQKLTTE